MLKCLTAGATVVTKLLLHIIHLSKAFTNYEEVDWILPIYQDYWTYRAVHYKTIIPMGILLLHYWPARWVHHLVINIILWLNRWGSIFITYISSPSFIVQIWRLFQKMYRYSFVLILIIEPHTDFTVLTSYFVCLINKI